MLTTGEKKKAAGTEAFLHVPSRLTILTLGHGVDGDLGQVQLELFGTGRSPR